MSEVLTCLPWCLLPPYRQFHFALPACRGRYYGIPHRGTSVVPRDGSGNGFWGQSSALLPLGGIINGELYIPSRSVHALCNTCTDLIVGALLGPSTWLSSPNQLPKIRFGEWWMWWELCLLILARASCIFQERSSSHRPWVGVV